MAKVSNEYLPLCILGLFPEDWVEASLSDVCHQVTDGTHDSPKAVSQGGYPLVTGKAIKNREIDFSIAYNISEEDHKKVISRSRPEIDDILFANIGNSIGDLVRVKSKNSFSIKNVALFKPDKNKVTPKYLEYFLLSEQVQSFIKGSTKGSAQPFIGLSTLRGFPIPLPSIDEQYRIGDLLGTLDDRITLLRETNTLLEQIAQTIFKSWFVDFDPVRAKQEGRMPEGMDEETAALFPDSFEESELGMVPRGWRVMPFLEACDMLGGAQPPASTFVDQPREGYVRLLQIRDFSTDAHKTYIPDTTKLRKAKEDDVLIGRYGSASGDKSKDSLGRVCRGLSGAYNVALMKLSPVEIGPEFALQLVNDPRFYGYLQGVSSKAVQSGFSKSELGQYKVVIPPRQLADEFEATGEALWKRIKTGKETLKILSDLRDTLLPRLISGKLRLPDMDVMEE